MVAQDVQDASASSRFVVSGCSGGGKSTLLEALRLRGYAVVPEPGRRIVEMERRQGGSALPWLDPAAFACRAVELSLEDLRRSEGGKMPIFFDRGLVDAAVALEHASGEPAIERLCRPFPYARQVFVAPPWSAIFEADKDRRHGFGEAVAEYERLLDAYTRLGCKIVLLPRSSVVERTDLVLAAVAATGSWPR